MGHDRHRRHELIAASGYGQNEAPLPCRLAQCLAQGEHALVQIVLCHDGLGPDHRHECGLVDDFTGALYQKAQRDEGSRWQRQVFPRRRYEHLLRRIEAKTCEFVVR
jgi:hypothetical protein